MMPPTRGRPCMTGGSLGLSSRVSDVAIRYDASNTAADTSMMVLNGSCII